MSVALSLKSATKSYNDVVVFSNLSLDLQTHKTTVVLGPSGCGKTTLMKCISMLEPFERGVLELENQSVFKDGKAINEKLLRMKVGIVFQDLYLWDNKPVLQNLMEALLHVKNLDPKEARGHAIDAANKLNINSELFNKYPPELSRGERQRVAIARTLVMNPDIILLDEVSASLDENLTGQLSQIINVLRDQGKTLMVVTHDSKFASNIGDNILQFNELSLAN